MLKKDQPSEGAESTSAVERRIAQDLDALRSLSQFRSLDLPPGIDLGSNDYLGLARDPRLKRAVIDALAPATRVASTGSRLLSGNAAEWQSLESEFADFIGTEAALYFNSGYSANLGLLASLLRPGDLVFSDEMNHASLIDGMRLSGATKVIYPHGDLAFLEAALREQSRVDCARILVTESVFSMEGDIAPVGELLRLAGRYDASLVLDEAHAMGVCGPQGRGVAAELGVQRELLAVVCTCGKALASPGAFVCGKQALKDFLINRARTFIFSTAMPPYIAGQIRAALALARTADVDRAYLRELAAELRDSLAAAGINCGASRSHIIPVILGSNEAALRAATELQRAGFAAKAIRPPTVPPGTARIRISLTAKITRDDAQRLTQVLQSVCPAPPSISRSSPVHA